MASNREFVATRIPKVLRDEIKAHIESTGLYLNEAEFIRAAIRDLIKEEQFFKKKVKKRA